MNKQELIATLAKEIGLSKTQAGATIDCLVATITKTLKKRGTVSLVGFGTFKTTQRKARTARNPQTGAAIKIAKRWVPKFTAGKALKTAVK